MRYKVIKYTIVTALAGMLTLAGVVWSQSGPNTYSLKVAPNGMTTCSSLGVFSPPFYECSGMVLLDSAGVPSGTAAWGYNHDNGTLALTLDLDGEVTNYSLPATQKQTSGTAAYPSCTGEWVIATSASNAPQVSINLNEYKPVAENASGCRASWQEGTVTE